MQNRFSRSELLIGKDGIELLSKSRVAVFGVGGVGGYIAEALARTGVGEIDLFDNDTVSITNINRQIIAAQDTLGKYKTDVMKERILSINPDAKVNAYRCFFTPDNSDEYDFRVYDYIADAVDTVTAKIEIAVKAQKDGIPVISGMGAGNKLDALSFEVADIYQTSVCPLARVMRYELRKRGVKSLKVVYSKAPVITPFPSDEITEKKSVPGSVAFVPSVAGLIIAGEIIKDLLNIN